MLDSKVQWVTEYMKAHLNEAIGIWELADLLDLSRFHFCTAFRKSTGFTPHHWLVRIRMERARELLTNSRLAIDGILRMSV